MHGGLGNVGMHVWHVHECVMLAGTLKGARGSHFATYTTNMHALDSMEFL